MDGKNITPFWVNHTVLYILPHLYSFVLFAMLRKIVFFQMRNGYRINHTTDVPTVLDPRLATMEFFEHVSRIKREQQQRQRRGSDSKSNDEYDDDYDEDDDIKQTEASKFTSSDCIGVDVQWVRAEVPPLPQRLAVAQCQHLYTCAILITYTPKK